MGISKKFFLSFETYSEANTYQFIYGIYGKREEEARENFKKYLVDIGVMNSDEALENKIFCGKIPAVKKIFIKNNKDRKNYVNTILEHVQQMTDYKEADRLHKVFHLFSVSSASNNK